MTKPQRGVATNCESMDPKALPEESAALQDQKPQAAPAPGVPMPDAEYKRMKEAARTTPARGAENAQEDRPKKKR